MTEENRPDPGLLLKKLQYEEKEKEKQTKGKLKIFLGYAAGSGKTYAMLEAAHEAKKHQVDVVAGYIEPHARPDTQAMAEAVAEGIKAAGQEAELLEVGNADAKTVAAVDAFALGCPAMGAEVLEESEMEPFVEELESYVSGKKILLFGSYGWGDGEWMRDWADRMKNAGAQLIREEGIIANEAPEDDVLEELKAAGKELAE